MSTKIRRNVNKEWGDCYRNECGRNSKDERRVPGSFGTNKVVRARDRVLAAIIRLRGGRAFALQTARHRLTGARADKAVEWPNEQYDCRKTKHDFDAARHSNRGYQRFHHLREGARAARRLVCHFFDLSLLLLAVFSSPDRPLPLRWE